MDTRAAGRWAWSAMSGDDGQEEEEEGIVRIED